MGIPRTADEWLTWWATRNPFTTDYVREEVANYGMEEYDADGVRVRYGEPSGVLDDYLNRAFRVGEVKVPILHIDGQLWMSLTPMECQSQHLPIQFAFDNVATCGLGLGHFVLRCMEYPMVESVTVFEQDSRIVDFFKQRFKDRPGFEKVKFVVGDAREKMRGYEFDFVYVDIYPSLCGDEVISDAKLFRSENEITQYHFWGQEIILIDAVHTEVLDASDIDWPTRVYFTKWYKTPIEDYDDDTTLANMYRVRLTPDFCQEVLDAIEYLDQ